MTEDVRIGDPSAALMATI
ncbi:hypothetical protein EYZ11_008623 [Aspergillus tanneri]|uniref:Uncharacterized protein n=1 Tax=Aspergillus tanneri TaxID=1220188 RepID=A0A4S3J9Z8_9EURO|nr:hypothetical protein EYZ11_008623 [Aspergillus tanneri]